MHFRPQCCSVGEVLFVGENGAHEPIPSVLYFCQPRVADERRLPWGKSWRGTYAIGIVLFKINLHAGKSFIRYCVMMMRDEKKYNPQGGSILACIVTQGRLRCTCQPCAIESITATRQGHTVRFGAIECAIRWGMNTPCDWRGLSNVQCDAVMAHRVVWWRWVVAAPMCPPVSSCKGATIIKYFHEKQHSHVFKMDDWRRCCFLYLGFCNIFMVCLGRLARCTTYFQVQDGWWWRFGRTQK